MPHNQDLGKEGESLAISFLQSQGYQILEQNWRFKRAEIDIIAKIEGILVFAEVKTRSSDSYGKPEEFVSKHKEDLMLDAAGNYMTEIQHEGEIRFDIIAVLIPQGKGPQIQHFEDAFFPFE